MIFSVEQVHQGREIQLLITDTEFGYVVDPLLIRRAGGEVAIEHIRCDLADLGSVGVALLLLPHATDQPERRDECEHGFIRYLPPCVNQHKVDAAIPIAAVVASERRCDCGV